MFGFIKKIFSILFIIVIYFMVITFFSLAKENKNFMEVSFDSLYPESPEEKLNKVFSYQLQFIQNIQNKNSSEEFENFLNAMLNSSIDLNQVLFHINTGFQKETLITLNRFLNEIYTAYSYITSNYNSDKVICIRVLLNEARNKLENFFTIDDQAQFQHQSL